MRFVLALSLIHATLYDFAIGATEEIVRTKYTNANQTLHRLINTGPINKFILHSPHYNHHTNYGIVLLVISAASEVELRREIRQQWASAYASRNLLTGKALVIFLVGRSPNLDSEAETYGDLLQIDIEETYRNLVYKVEAGILWLSKHVNSKFVAKIDSDTVVHIDRLLMELKIYERKRKSNNFIICSIYEDGEPHRDDYEKWYTSYSDYPGERYPRFCAGPGYVMSRVAFEKIVGEMGKHHVIEVEDVFFTGIVAENMIDYIHDGGVVASQYTKYSQCDTHGFPVQSILCTHDQFDDSRHMKDITAAWKQLQEPICNSGMRLLLALVIIFAAINQVSARKIGINWKRAGEGLKTKYTDANQTLHQLINTGPIDKFILRSPRYSNTTKYGIVLLVISAASEVNLRREIRQQWAARHASINLMTRKALVVFLVGRDFHSSAQLESETKAHGDHLQVDIEETYRNLVYKIEIGFLWLSKHIDSEFVAKIDSDTVVHIDRLYSTLKRYETKQKSNNFLVCSSVWNAGPIRDTQSPWYTSHSDYPSRVFPRFCNGPGYVMSQSAFDKIVVNMNAHKILEVEDVFFTGVVATDVVADVIDEGVVATEYRSYSECGAHGPLLSILCTHHQFRESKYLKDITAAWKQLKSPKCLTYGYSDRFRNHIVNAVPKGNHFRNSTAHVVL